MNLSDWISGTRSRRTRRWLAAGAVAFVASSIVIGVEVAGGCDEATPTRLGSLRPTVVGRAVVVPSGGVAEVRSLVDGRVASVLVREGDRVEQGALLAEIVNDAIGADEQRRAAEQRGAEASAAAVQKGARPEERQEANAALVQAEHDLALARDREARQRGLVDSGAAAAATLVETQSAVAVAVADARRTAALARARLTAAGGRAEEIRAAQARADALRASVDSARFSSQQLRIIAPISGTVLSRTIDPGDVVSGASTGASAQLFEIADLDRTELKIEIEEGDAESLAVGLEVVSIAPLPIGNAARCSIDRISPRMARRSIGVDDARSRAEGQVRAAWCPIDARGARLVVGQRVDVRVVLLPTEPTSLAPRDAVVVRDGQVALRTRRWFGDRFDPIELGRVDDGEVEVLSARVVR